MKQITISGEILPEHWFGENEVTEQDVTEQLSAVSSNEDVEIVINSPGGDVFTAIAIFNHIREFAKTHFCTVIMQGIVGSAASYIALAAKAGNPSTKIKAYDNSIFFIHNAQGYAHGDYREMEKMALLCKSISDLICNSAYAKVSSDSVEEIHKAMDNETYYFGAEIAEHGYADIIEGADAKDEEGVHALEKNTLLAQAKVEVKNAMVRLEQWENQCDDNKRLAAKLSNSFMASLEKTQVKNLTGGEKLVPQKMEDSKMDITELKSKYPDLYNSVFAAGVEDERSRVTAHLKMATDSGDVGAAVDFIKAGTPVSANDVTAKYHEVFCKTQLKAARVSDNVPSVTVPEPDKTDEQKAVLSAYKKMMLGGK